MSGRVLNEGQFGGGQMIRKGDDWVEVSPEEYATYRTKKKEHEQRYGALGGPYDHWSDQT